MKETIFVAGGDGFCGWATSLHLSNLGYNVVILDNLSRRKIDIDLGCNSLTPIRSIDRRLDKWYEITGKVIKYYNIDLSLQYELLLKLFNEYRPMAVVHFAEQRAAPMSMKSSY